MSDAENLIRYYHELYTQAPERAEDGYGHPDRQDELDELHERVQELVQDHHVLELACGRGFWTEIMAETAAAVLATDVDATALAIAAAAELPNVSYAQADADNLPADLFDRHGKPTMVFAGLFWPHVPRQDQDRFLAHLRDRVGKDAMLVLVGETYVETVSQSVARTDAQNNTCQIHALPDGQRLEVVYNFPSDSTLRKKLGPSVRDIRIVRFEHYWLLSCRLK